MSRLVLVTRAIEQGREFAAELKDIGAVPLIQPLLEIEYEDVDLQKIKRPDAILLTSVHSVKGREFPNLWQDIPVFCVGDKTEFVARQAGAKNCVTGRGGIDDVLPIIRKKIPIGQSILYLSGAHTARNIKSVLPSYDVHPVVTYHAKAVEDVAPDVIESFYRLHTITLFSPRTGLILKQFMEKHNFNHFAGTINLLCLSSSVLESVKDMKWKSCHVADVPTQSGMIDKLNTIFKSG